MSCKLSYPFKYLWTTTFQIFESLCTIGVVTALPPGRTSPLFFVMAGKNWLLRNGVRWNILRRRRLRRVAYSTPEVNKRCEERFTSKVVTGSCRSYRRSCLSHRWSESRKRIRTIPILHAHHTRKGCHSSFMLINFRLDPVFSHSSTKIWVLEGAVTTLNGSFANGLESATGWLKLSPMFRSSAFAIIITSTSHRWNELKFF